MLETDHWKKGGDPRTPSRTSRWPRKKISMDRDAKNPAVQVGFTPPAAKFTAMDNSKMDKIDLVQQPIPSPSHSPSPATVFGQINNANPWDPFLPFLQNLKNNTPKTAGSSETDRIHPDSVTLFNHTHNTPSPGTLPHRTRTLLTTPMGALSGVPGGDRTCQNFFREVPKQTPKHIATSAVSQSPFFGGLITPLSNRFTAFFSQNTLRFASISPQIPIIESQIVKMADPKPTHLPTGRVGGTANPISDGDLTPALHTFFSGDLANLPHPNDKLEAPTSRSAVTEDLQVNKKLNRGPAAALGSHLSKTSRTSSTPDFPTHPQGGGEGLEKPNGSQKTPITCMMVETEAIKITSCDAFFSANPSFKSAHPADYDEAQPSRTSSTPPKGKKEHLETFENPAKKIQSPNLPEEPIVEIDQKSSQLSLGGEGGDRTPPLWRKKYRRPLHGQPQKCRRPLL